MHTTLPALLRAIMLSLFVAGAVQADIPPETRPETPPETPPETRADIQADIQADIRDTLQQVQNDDAISWLEASEHGHYDLAVQLGRDDIHRTELAQLIRLSREKDLSSDPQWRAFLHYKTAGKGRWISQVDAAHFFLSDTGKQDPQAELEATLAAFFARSAKPPLRLSAYCRFVARRVWLEEQLGDTASFLPARSCPEFDQFVKYLDAHTLTLIFPSAHPNSPSSAFGHTLLRIDKQDQRQESRLLNMSINFAAEVAQGVSGGAYAIKGLTGGFPGRFRMLPYHMKLREYGQIENRDTWEYPLNLDKAAVDLVLRHSYEMLVSEFDYYFFTENCSYHLLSLLDVAVPGQPLTDAFGRWTIPIDTIRLLRERGLVSDGRFVPSAISLLRARQETLSDAELQLALAAVEGELPVIESLLDKLDIHRQASILDLLSDYERYTRLKSDPSALGSNERERAILSRRSRLGVQSEIPAVDPPGLPPDSGHGTARLSISHHYAEDAADVSELQFRPAYHDFRDPSAAFDAKATIELGAIVIAMDHTRDSIFLRRLTLFSIESIEPRSTFFKPISWHTNLDWQRSSADARHEATFNVGAGAAFQLLEEGPVVFMFGESDIVDAPAFDDRQQLRLGASAGIHWEPVPGIRTGVELDYRHQVGGDYYSATSEFWAGIAIGEHMSINVDMSITRSSTLESQRRTSAGVRLYF